MKPRHRNLPRLERDYYRGIGAVHWIYSVEKRATGWLTDRFHHHFREILTHATVRYGSVAPVYYLMPDHIHIMLWGYREDSDTYLATRFIRKHTGTQLAPALYQKQAYDHVLQETKSPATLSRPCATTFWKIPFGQRYVTPPKTTSSAEA
jgi:hypothetical protein